MSYTTLNVASPTDLLQQLVAWLVADGWTSHLGQADGTGWRAHLSRNGLYVNLRATPGNVNIWGGGTNRSAFAVGLGVYVGTGYSAAAAWNAQPGGPKGAGQSYTVGGFMPTGIGSVPVDVFSDDAGNVVVVVERDGGIFTHMAWGPDIHKCSPWPGGAYFSASLSGFHGGDWVGIGGSGAMATTFGPGAHGGDSIGSAAAFLRVDVDTFAGSWVGVTSRTSAWEGYTGKAAASAIPGAGTFPADIPECSALYLQRQVSDMNGQAALTPVRWYVQRDGGGYSLVGTLPNLWSTNACSMGFGVRSLIQLGADTLVLYPNFAVRRVS